MAKSSGDVLINTYSVSFQLPSYDILTVEMAFSTKFYDLSVKDLKHKLLECGFHVDYNRIRLIQFGEELSDDLLLKSSKFARDSVVEVIVKVVDMEICSHHFKYDDFVHFIAPTEGQINIPTVGFQIQLTLKPNCYAHILHLPSLFSRDADFSSYHGDDDMVSNFKNKSEAIRCGYKEWPSGPMPQKERILLLEVDETLDLHLDSIRYDVDSSLNYEYNRGDNNSWQRYTTQLPVPCQIDSSFDLSSGNVDVSTALTVLTLTPYTPLKRNTQYAILLCNGVPTMPCALRDAGLHSFHPNGMGEDRLYLFRTEL